MRAPSLGFLAIAALTGLCGTALAQRGGLQPGQWEMTTNVKVAGIPGMKMTRDQSHTTRYCLTPQAALDGSRAMLISRGCSFKRFVMANGKIDAETVCGGAGRAMSSTTTGTYTPTTLHTTSHSNFQGPAGMMINHDLQGHWVGLCTAGK